MIQAISKNAKILAIFAIVCTAIVGLIHELTKARIAEQAEQQLLNTLHSIIDPNRLNNDLYHDCLLVTNELLGSTQPQTVYLARQDGKSVAAAITSTAPDGYNGNIYLLIAVNIDGSISGVRTLQHNETPGLGDKIELRKSQWIRSFDGKKVESDNDPLWTVKKNGGMFDQFTGATITPRAVVKAVQKTVLYFQQNKQQLFAQTGSCREQK
jgi:electron transport complex protein RnfG